LQKDTQNKRKKLKSFDWRKKNKGKIKRYILLKCKTIKTLLFEQDETNRRGRAKPLHASLKNALLFLSNLPSTSFWSHHHTPAKKKP
jgi:rRNA pseudouridine-1189 N-methylase Emg1 (Nep1/Mra1 family)